jgi:hypothetical protein
MNKQIIVILIAFTFLGCKNFQIRNKKYLEKLLVGKGNSNWDPYWNNSDTIVGLGLHIIDKNNLVLYIYKNKIRTKYDYGGDIILDTLPWNLNADTLFISCYYKFKISSIKNNELKIEDCEHHLKAVFKKKDNLPLQ